MHANVSYTVDCAQGVSHYTALSSTAGKQGPVRWSRVKSRKLHLTATVLVSFFSAFPRYPLRCCNSLLSTGKKHAAYHCSFDHWTSGASEVDDAENELLWVMTEYYAPGNALKLLREEGGEEMNVTSRCWKVFKCSETVPSFVLNQGNCSIFR